MIKFNSNDINDWYDGSDVIKKAYFNGNVAYIRIYAEPLPPPHTPCYAVTSNIATYSDTDFVDVYNQADSSWYKLNNLDQFEKYGVYGTSTGVSETYYEGKLSVDDGYEYVYSGNSWVLLGEVSGSTATLPDVPFTVNYNAKNYNSNTKTLAKTQGQLADIDAVITAGTPTVNDGYLAIDSGTRATISGYQTYFNRDNNNPNLTIISKQQTNDYNGCHMFANRDSNYNWMYRPYSTYMALHGSSEQGYITVTTQPVIESVRIDSNRTATYNNYTDNTSSSYSNFSYGGTNNGATALFAGYANSSGEWFYGDFYWVYMSQNTLTDAQVQQVIAYNEEGGSSEYPEYYEEKDVPPNHLVFADMKEANLYECPWVGMEATIDGIHYYYTPNYMWELEMPTPSGHTEVEYIENTSTAYIDTGLKLYSSTTNTFTVEAKVIGNRFNDGDYYQNIICCMSEAGEPYQGFLYRYQSVSVTTVSNPTYEVSFNVTNNQDGTTSITATCYTIEYSHDYPLVLCCGLDASKQPFRFCDTKIYSLKVTLNGTVVMNAIPVVNSDNQPCLYDQISGVYFLSPNGTAFVAGPTV